MRFHNKPAIHSWVWFCETTIDPCYRTAGNSPGTKFLQMAPKMKIPGYNFRRCCCTVQNENTIMPNSWIIHNFTNVRPTAKSVKFCPIKNALYTVCHLLTQHT